MIIDVQHVTWKRGPITLLNDVSWRVNEGEHWALLGLNGSGKTTLLNMITGYLWPTEGTITVLGHRYGDVDLRELRKSIGWVSSSLQEKLYGTDRTQYVVISGKHATIGLYDKLSDEDLDQARELMRTLGCQHLWDREYRTCSQGEKQKLLIARALMANPRVLILDEPCNGLDLFSRERLLESIRELTQKPDTPSLIYVTHHTEEILPVFSHSLLLRRGEIVNSGLTSELMNRDVLSSFFEAPVDVDRHGQRVYVRAAEQ
ncbi:ABC transporter ATP-binding protein [Paenibacillus sp. JNUCC31]|uniref:ABC transporter ATP-binding protein n=1 Tax=Paenibacillus sp. JNUCC-31 TaxID=2777983 RepID=UPI00177F863B|nr:ABC transporter ATP-binding protein [Paenibacillus sp. JNUCC-31]QOS81758.1 ABC transporter ATP-binding protein [Paenibacillus sp. JNUCC-31]